MSALAGLGLGFVSAVAAAPINYGVNQITFQLGFNTVARDRDLLYVKQEDSATRFIQGQPQGGAGQGLVANPNYVPTEFSVDTAIAAFNMLPWHLAYNDSQAGERFWLQLAWQLGINGIDISLQEPFGIKPATDLQDAPTSVMWTRYIEMSSTPAPLSEVIRAYWRSTVIGAANKSVSEDELNFNLQRSRYRREQDRDRLLYPFVPWAPQDAVRLRWLGVIDDDEMEALLRAAGVSHGDDRDWTDYLTRVWPEPHTLLNWSMRGIYDDAAARDYGLDDGLQDSEAANYFARAGGLNVPQGKLPGQDFDTPDWAKLIYRASRPLPGWGAANDLQHRLRPLPDDPAKSVVPGVPPWLAADTINMLRLQGYPRPIIDRLMGIVYNPINVRVIQTVLHEALTHPNVAADAQAAYGKDVDWVAGAYLDHGFSPPAAKLAADGARAKADDSIHAERIDEQRRLDKESRDITLKRYAVGLITRKTVIDLTAGEQFSSAMANQACRNIDTAAELALAEAHLAAIHEGYMAGKLSLDQVSAQMTVLGISDFMKGHYIQEWTWKRADSVRMLSTEKIIAALKRGLLTPQLALARMTNLGWLQADAVIEIAQAEQEIAQAAQHQQSAAAAKAAAIRMKQERAEASAARAAENASKRAAADAVKESKAAARVPLESAAGISAYDARALIDLDAYNKAKKAGDTALQQAQIEKAQAAYLDELLRQLELAQANPEAAHEIEPVERISVPPVGQGQGAGQAAAGAAQPPSGTSAADGGAGAAPAPG